MNPNCHADVWAAARPYMRARKNDVHIPLSYRYAERLLERHRETRVPWLSIPPEMWSGSSWTALRSTSTGDVEPLRCAPRLQLFRDRDAVAELTQLHG